MPSQTSKRRQQSFNMLLRNVLLQFFIVKGNYILANKWILRKTSFHFSVFCQISIENWRLEGIFGIGLEIYQRKSFTNLWSRSNKRETWTKSFLLPWNMEAKVRYENTSLIGFTGCRSVESWCPGQPNPVTSKTKTVFH